MRKLIHVSDNSYDAKARKFCIDLVEATTPNVIDPSAQTIEFEKDEKEKEDQENDKMPKREKLFMKFNCLVCFDDGHGMTPLELHRMLSFGHCDKVLFKIHLF